MLRINLFARPHHMRDSPKGVTPDWLWARCVPEPNVGCWIWLGTVDTGGYGVIATRIGRLTRHHGAHRVSFRLHHGPVPHGHVVMHKCDVPACINPAHLSHGTLEENNADRHKKGRTRIVEPRNRARGERQGLAKLTATAVVDIRRRAAAGEEYSAIATTYGVSDVAIGLAAKRQTWRHIP